MQKEGFNLASIAAETIGALISPSKHFEALGKMGQHPHAFHKVVVYSLLTALMFLPLTHTVPAPAFIVVPLLLIVMPLVGIIEILAGSIGVMALSAISGGNTKFKQCFSVAASLAALMPVQGFFTVIATGNRQLGIIFSSIVLAWLLWLLYFALTKALMTRVKVTGVVISVVAFMLIVITVQLVAFRDYLRENQVALQQGIEEARQSRGNTPLFPNTGFSGRADEFQSPPSIPSNYKEEEREAMKIDPYEEYGRRNTPKPPKQK